jgi:DNA/RNA-binding domain of Phe-tRNA-synthetase-like protein
MYFVVSSQVFAQMPTVCFGVVAAYGIDNSKPVPAIAKLLQTAISDLQVAMQGTSPKDHPHFAPYRQAFQQLGINPNKYPSSVEAMTKRIIKGSDLPSINPVVDLANAVSLRFMLPMGAHDIDALQDDLTVRFAEAGDSFIPFGADQVETVAPGELVYASGDRVRTRRWIWRQSQMGSIQPESKNIFFPIDGFAVHRDKIKQAQMTLEDLLVQHFSCQTKSGWVDAHNQRWKL